ncbi:MAG: DEAD/DEAH box helicase [Desulfamplus sp.]|nr:DEAD/DEAH box helicase [Desulfamplus sp.]
MKTDINDIFFKLKKRKRVIERQKVVPLIYFQLNFDDIGAYIQTVDSSNKEVQVSYEYYSGHTREILSSIDRIKQKNSFQVNWDNPDNKVYLSENNHLLWILKHCDNFVDSELKPIKFVDSQAKIYLMVEEDKKKPAKNSKNTPNKNSKNELHTKIFVSHQGREVDNFFFLNENNILADGSIYPVKPVGEHFNELKLFETSFSHQKLESYLSLFLSYFQNVSIKYGNFKSVEGNPKKAVASLIFEKVDPNNTLYLMVSTSLQGFDTDFFDNYEINKIASINDLEKKIVVSDLLHEDVYSCFGEINSLLKKHKKSIKQDSNFFLDDNLFIIESDLAQSFIHQELPNLISHYPILGAEKLKSYKVKSATPKLKLNLSYGIDFLEGDAHLEIEGELISLFDALNEYQKKSYISLNDGTHAIINKDYINKLKRIFKKRDEKVKLSFFDLPIIEDLIDENIANQDSFKRSKEVFMGFNNLANMHQPIPKLTSPLRTYQEQGYQWIKYLQQHSLGGCLADDMGLGKTIQAISLLASIYPKEKTSSLIVMPKSLIFNWESEIKKFATQLTFYIYHGANREISEAQKSNIILTTYATLRNDIQSFKEQEFNYVILDESQNIKNLSSQISKSAMLLKAKNRLALSGTPVENNLLELYALFRFLTPSMLGSVDEFNKNYAIPIQKNDDKEALNELKKKIYPFILRRLKQDVLKELPDKIEQTIFVDMSDEQKEFYEHRRAFYYKSVKSQIMENGIQKSQFIILQALSELRQLASIPESKSDNIVISPKREVLIEYILDIVSNNHKVLVFANYLNALDIIGQDLESNGIDFLLMTGATRDRKELVKKFQYDDTYKVFLMTLKTGGIGLNLTAADYVFIFDPWWNKSAENQAIDRAHRIGQDKTVFSYKLITRGTIEEKILELQRLKSELFNTLISSDGASIKSLDEKDVEFILGNN